MSTPPNNLGGTSTPAAGANGGPNDPAAPDLRLVDNDPDGGDVDQDAGASDGEDRDDDGEQIEQAGEKDAEATDQDVAASKAQVELTIAQKRAADLAARVIKLKEPAGDESDEQAKVRLSSLKGAQGELSQTKKRIATLEQAAKEAAAAAQRSRESKQKLAAAEREQKARREREHKAAQQGRYHAASDRYHRVKAEVLKEFECVRASMEQLQQDLEAKNAELVAAFHAGDWARFDKAVAAIDEAAGQHGG